MNTSPCFVFRISLTLDKKGFKWDKSEWLVKRRNDNETFLCSETGAWKRRIQTKQIDGHIISSVPIDSHRRIEYYAWCSPENEQDAKQRLQKAVTQRAAMVRNEMLQMLHHIEKTAETC